MSRLLKAMDELRAIFELYSGKEGDKETLSKTELSELLRKELPMPGTKSAEVTNFFSMLDNDGDGVVNFQEYVTFVAALTAMCHSK